ncbi:hypothetical protein MJK71_09805 [Escherichia coli]|nr:hypothetical protein MJK71_09805 [Escherichia coli]
MPFTAVCYSLNTFLALKEKPHCRAFLCGGEDFTPATPFSNPSILQQTLNNFSPDIAFLFCGGRALSSKALPVLILKSCR